jgi:hypothetical protein
MASGVEYSRGEWLIPSTLGMKIIPMGHTRAMFCASCPAPLGSDRVAIPRAAALSPMSARTRGSHSAGSCTVSTR